MKSKRVGFGEWKRGACQSYERAIVYRTLKYPPGVRDSNPTLLDQTGPTQKMDVPFVYKGPRKSWEALGDLYEFIWWEVSPKGDKKDMNALGDLLGWNKALISSFYDRALHPIGHASEFAVRSHDLTIL